MRPRAPRRGPPAGAHIARKGSPSAIRPLPQPAHMAAVASSAELASTLATLRQAASTEAAPANARGQLSSQLEALDAPLLRSVVAQLLRDEIAAAAAAAALSIVPRVFASTALEDEDPDDDADEFSPPTAAGLGGTSRSPRSF